MNTRDYAEKVLAIISLAWGPEDNTGYCFFPWIKRIDGVAHFTEVGFLWPDERANIVTHITDVLRERYDLYWCPMLFDGARRKKERAHEEYCLWADLDEVDPRKIDKQWKPSVAWETSPGRYQALWLLENPDEEDLYGASQRGADNHRMTAMVGADPSGWDTTQLLRLPGWTNHKPEYRVNKVSPRGKLLWSKGPRYTGQDFNELPEILLEDSAEPDLSAVSEALDVDREEVIARVRPLIPRKVLTKLSWSTPQGADRSSTLFVLMKYFADAGCSAPEIVSIFMPTVWNKFKGREEYLAKEATKAVKESPKNVGWRPIRLDAYVAAQKKPAWLVKDLLIANSVGFIAGEPKSRKSWVALDLAFSVAMNQQGYGTQFLGHYDVMNSGPVLYVTLEDGGWLLKDRTDKMWRCKNRTINQGMIPTTDGVDWLEVPDLKRPDVRIDILDGVQMDLSDPIDRVKLLDVVEDGHTLPTGEVLPYALVVIDTLMRGVGTTDMNNMAEVMAMLNPLTLYTKRPDVETTILIVHHFNKTRTEGDTRGGSRMMGSQALHAWAVDSLYLTATDTSVSLESESKMAPTIRATFNLDPTQLTWSPQHAADNTAPVRGLDFSAVERPRQRNRDYNAHGKLKNPKVINALYRLGPGPHRCADIAREAGMSPSNAHTSLTTAYTTGRVAKEGRLWRLT